MLYEPSALLWTVRSAPVSKFLAVTVAFGTTAPALSRTTPAILPVCTWAVATAATNIHTNVIANSIALLNFVITPPSRLSASPQVLLLPALLLVRYGQQFGSAGTCVNATWMPANADSGYLG